MGSTITIHERRWLHGAIFVGLIARWIAWGNTRGGLSGGEVLSNLEVAHNRIFGFGLTYIDPTNTSAIHNLINGAWMFWGQRLGLDGWTVHRGLCLHYAFMSLAIIPAVGRAFLAAVPSGGPRLTGYLWTIGVAALYPPLLYHAPRVGLSSSGLVALSWCFALTVENVFRRRENIKAWAVLGALLGATGFLDIGTLPLLGTLLVWTVYNSFRCSMTSLCVASLTWWALNVVFDGLAIYNHPRLAQPLREALITAQWPWQNLANLAALTGTSGVFLLALALNGPKLRSLLIAGLAASLIFLTNTYSASRPTYILPWLIAISGLGVTRLAQANHLPLGQHLRKQRAILMLAIGINLPALGNVLMKDWRHNMGGLFASQRFIGEQSDATGILMDRPILETGGYSILSRNVPIYPHAIDERIVSHRLFNYAIVEDGAPCTKYLERYGFEGLWKYKNFAVYKRIHPIDTER